MSDFENDLEKSLEEAFHRSEKSRKLDSERSQNDAPEAVQVQPITTRKAKFKPIGSKKSSVNMGMPSKQVIEDESRPAKVKYVRGPDGKLKKKVKRIRPKEGIANSVTDFSSGDVKISEVGSSIEKNTTVAEKKGLGSDSVGIPAIQEDTSPESSARLIAKGSQVSEKKLASEFTDKLSRILPDSEPVITQAEATSLFSDEDSSDYNPFEEQEEEENSTLSSTRRQMPTGDYFRETGVSSSTIPASTLPPSANPLIQNRGIIDALKAASENSSSKSTVSEDSSNRLRKLDSFGSVLMAVSRDYDAYDIDADMGGEGKWADDDDDSDVTSSQTRKKHKRR